MPTHNKYRAEKGEQKAFQVKAELVSVDHCVDWNCLNIVTKCDGKNACFVALVAHDECPGNVRVHHRR